MRLEFVKTKLSLLESPHPAIKASNSSQGESRIVLRVIEIFLCVDFFLLRIEGRVHGTKGSIMVKLPEEVGVLGDKAVRRVGPGALMSYREYAPV